MSNWLERMSARWRGGEQQPPPGMQARTFRAKSLPEDLAKFTRGLNDFIPLPNATPFEMLGVYRLLRDTNPDVSGAIWSWKRLCQTGYDIEILGASSSAAENRARQMLQDLDRRVNSGDRGMDGLLDIVYASLFTYGAAALEIVLSQGRDTIWDVVPIDVWTLRFRRESGGLQAYQLHEGQEIKLPMERFIYLGLDRDGTNPYGRSMLRSLPLALRIQQRLIADMAKATHNAGWNKFHVQYSPGPRSARENDEQFRKRYLAEFEELRNRLSGIEADQNLVTSDNVKVTMLRGDQRAGGFYENHKAIEEQVITGMHLMPILLGRNYGTTETYGTAQFEIINRQVETVNRNVKRVLEQLYNFELAMLWGEARARVRMRHNRTLDVLREAQARSREIQNTAELLKLGFIDNDKATHLLNL